MTRRACCGGSWRILNWRSWKRSPWSTAAIAAGERMTAALVSLGRKQLTELAEDPNGIELTCQFCDSRQRFTPEEIRELLEKGLRSLTKQTFCPPVQQGTEGLKKKK